ncbi:MAG: NAD(+)/NADH kinase [Clostridia bacterium]|nr:NAD(+)/NADH kinase [Clostridia bacterium]
MKKIVLIPNMHKDKDFTVTREVIAILSSFCTHIYVEKTLTGHLPDVTSYSEDAFPKDAELILLIGGDGTMLRAAPLSLRYNIPLLGVNMGRLGYLTSVEQGELSLLYLLRDNDFVVEERMTLSLSFLTGQGKEEPLPYFALNEVAVTGMGHLADIRLYEGEESIDYRADGLLVATPTGSTAYSLSAGGPVIEDDMDAICVTPICPRSFFSRSLLFGGKAVLRIENIGSREQGLGISIDGRENFVLDATKTLEIKKSSQKIRILSLQPKRLLRVLCTKMKMNHF